MYQGSIVDFDCKAPDGTLFQLAILLWTNIFVNLNKYICQFGQIHFDCKAPDGTLFQLVEEPILSKLSQPLQLSLPSHICFAHLSIGHTVVMLKAHPSFRMVDAVETSLHVASLSLNLQHVANLRVSFNKNTETDQEVIKSRSHQGP